MPYLQASVDCQTKISNPIQVLNYWFTSTRVMSQSTITLNSSQESALSTRDLHVNNVRTAESSKPIPQFADLGTDYVDQWSHDSLGRQRATARRESKHESNITMPS